MMINIIIENLKISKYRLSKKAESHIQQLMIFVTVE